MPALSLTLDSTPLTLKLQELTAAIAAAGDVPENARQLLDRFVAESPAKILILRTDSTLVVDLADWPTYSMLRDVLQVAGELRAVKARLKVYEPDPVPIVLPPIG